MGQTREEDPPPVTTEPVFLNRVYRVLDLSTDHLWFESTGSS